jgi:DUF971 family protein
MIAKQITLKGKTSLGIVWDDLHESEIPLKSLRNNCPCAGCQGETVLLKTYKPIPQPDLPGKYNLIDAEQIGSYALKLVWADGHQTGIYTWERLRAMCECSHCTQTIRPSNSSRI